MPDIPTLRRILSTSETIAMVGLSAKWFRPSFFAAKYLQEHGYRVIPVNPNYAEILGETCYPDLTSIPHRIDVVDLFQRAETTPAYARQAVEIGATTLWLQLEITNPEAESIASSAGLDYVENRCMKIEHARLFGGLNFAGVNTRVISSQRSRHIAN